MFLKISSLYQDILFIAFQEDIANKIADILNNLIASVRTVATPLAVIGLIFCVIKIFTSPDEKTVRTAKQGAIWIFIAVGVIWLAEPIINTIKSLAS